MTGALTARHYFGIHILIREGHPRCSQYCNSKQLHFRVLAAIRADSGKNGRLYLFSLPAHHPQRLKAVLAPVVIVELPQAAIF